MKPVFYFFFAVFTWWSLRVTTSDLATKKIPNASMVLGAKLTGAALLILAAITLLGVRGYLQQYPTWNFYPMWATHAFWCVVAGLVLWYAEIWPAGDAKFYILTAAALPLINPELRNFPNYLFLSLLINIFTAAAAFSLISFVSSGMAKASPSAFFSETVANLKPRFAAAFSGGRAAAAALSYAAGLTLLFLLQQMFNMEVLGRAGHFVGRTDVLYFFLFFLWDKAGKLFRSRYSIAAGALLYGLYLALGLLFFRSHMLAMLFYAVKNMLRFSLLLFLGRFILEFLLEKKDEIFVGAEEVKPGMILSAKSTRELRTNPVFAGEFEDCFRDGLDEEQAALISGWLKKMPQENAKIIVIEGRPFALWIFAGTALTLIFNRTLLTLLR